MKWTLLPSLLFGLLLALPSLAESRIPPELGLTPLKSRKFDDAALAETWSGAEKRYFVVVTGVHFNERWVEEWQDQFTPGFY